MTSAAVAMTALEETASARVDTGAREASDAAATVPPGEAFKRKALSLGAGAAAAAAAAKQA